MDSGEALGVSPQIYLEGKGGDSVFMLGESMVSINTLLSHPQVFKCFAK